MTFNPSYRAINAARRSREMLTGFEVVLSRVEDDIVYMSTTIKARLGETLVDEIIESGAVVSTRLRDILVESADYAFLGLNDGNPVAPKAGDNIRVTLASGWEIYEVMPQEDSREYRRADRAGMSWRVHTREVSNGIVTL